MFVFLYLDVFCICSLQCVNSGVPPVLRFTISPLVHAHALCFNHEMTYDLPANQLCLMCVPEKDYVSQASNVFCFSCCNEKGRIICT